MEPCEAELEELVRGLLEKRLRARAILSFRRAAQRTECRERCQAGRSAPIIQTPRFEHFHSRLGVAVGLQVNDETAFETFCDYFCM